MSESYFDYKEFVEYSNKLGIAEKEFQLWLCQFLLKEAQRVVANAKQRQRAVGAIDTGFMINSWTIGDEAKVLHKNKNGKYSVVTDSAFAVDADITDIKIIGDTLQVTIQNTAEYSSFIEFGQRSYTGKYLLTIAIHTVQSALPNRFANEFKKFCKNKGVS